jgi:hypothetical protein
MKRRVSMTWRVDGEYTESLFHTTVHHSSGVLCSLPRGMYFKLQLILYTVAGF